MLLVAAAGIWIILGGLWMVGERGALFLVNSPA